MEDTQSGHKIQSCSKDSSLSLLLHHSFYMVLILPLTLCRWILIMNFQSCPLPKLIRGSFCQQVSDVCSQRNENIIYGTRKPRALADAESRTRPGRQKGSGFPSVFPPRLVPSKHGPQRHYLFAFSKVFGTGRGFKSAANYPRAVGSQAFSCSPACGEPRGTSEHAGGCTARRDAI